MSDLREQHQHTVVDILACAFDSLSTAQVARLGRMTPDEADRALRSNKLVEQGRGAGGVTLWSLTYAAREALEKRDQRWS